MNKNTLAASIFALAAFFWFASSCQSTRKIRPMSSMSTAPIFDLQGHRGCRGLMPENTIPAMLRALELGVTTLEMDVVISGDGQVVLSHEPFFNHEISRDPTGKPIPESQEKKHNLYRLTYNQISQYDVGLQPHPRFPQQAKIAAQKPTLATLMDEVEKFRQEKQLPPCWFNIETKTNAATDHLFHPAPAEFVDKLMSVIRAKHIESRTIIQSFDVRTLQYLHQKYPSIQTALLIEDDDKRPLPVHLERLGFTPSIYSPYHEHVDATLVQQCRTQGMRLIPWTVNLLPRMQQLKELGVDGIISDYPNLFAELMAAHPSINNSKN